MNYHLIAPFRALLATLLFVAMSGASSAEEFRVKAQLAWGTNDDKPASERGLHELNPAIRDKFRHLRWTNYFVVKELAAPVSAKAPKRLVLSDKCAVDLHDKGDGQIEIGILSLKPNQPATVVKTDVADIAKMRKGHVYVFGGDTKEKWDDAWLVILTADDLSAATVNAGKPQSVKAP
jgi:hypothetical protein